MGMDVRSQHCWGKRGRHQPRPLLTLLPPQPSWRGLTHHHFPLLAALLDQGSQQDRKGADCTLSSCLTTETASRVVG